MRVYSAGKTIKGKKTHRSKPASNKALRNEGNRENLEIAKQNYRAILGQLFVLAVFHCSGQEEHGVKHSRDAGNEKVLTTCSYHCVSVLTEFIGHDIFMDYLEIERKPPAPQTNEHI